MGPELRQPGLCRPAAGAVPLPNNAAAGSDRRVATPRLSAGDSFTTVGNWQQPGELHFRGEVYHWSKHHEFLKFLELPSRTNQVFELALGSYDPDDQQLLESKGWHVRPALEISTDGDTYRRYVQQSRGEFTVAKDQNVRLRSGWFSERRRNTWLPVGRSSRKRRASATTCRPARDSSASRPWKTL